MINVFEILSNLEHIFRVCSEYVQGIFRVCSEYGQRVFRVGSEKVQRRFRVCSEYVQSMLVGCQDWLSRLVVKIVVIASSSASSVSVFGIFHICPLFHCAQNVKAFHKIRALI